MNNVTFPSRDQRVAAAAPLGTDGSRRGPECTMPSLPARSSQIYGHAPRDSLLVRLQ